ncbi:MAG: SDR family oxidoreductase [Dehalococcoidia bacterium]|jgi:NAD(P)-dependent dehydrogenase (short-subunit alcohol dehydrogenase family)|nr:SDR family oxidoreductase [Dehalococcoidia bacterium]MDP7613435.1 SDR family oxidoreductase [Dehalococcoidia bacterium]
MPVDLKGKCIIVTGGATGIGRATALRVSAYGAKVAIFDVNAGEGANTVNDINELGGNARYWQVDVRDEAAVSGAVEAATNWLTDIDILIHVAGVLQGEGVEIDEFPENIWDIVLDTNLRGSFLVSKYVSSVMIQNKKGVIILTSSGAGVKGGSSSYAYGASKGGVHGLTLVLQQYLESHGIRVNDVAPGSVKTPLKVKNVNIMHQKAKDNINLASKYSGSLEDKLNDLTSPDDVAKIIAFMASDEANLLKGTVFTG